MRRKRNNLAHNNNRKTNYFIRLFCGQCFVHCSFLLDRKNLEDLFVVLCSHILFVNLISFNEEMCVE